MVAFEIACNMKSANIPIESIMQFTKLSREEFEKLQCLDRLLLQSTI